MIEKIVIRGCGNCKFYIDGKCGTDGEEVKPDHICYGYTEKEDRKE